MYDNLGFPHIKILHDVPQYIKKTERNEYKSISPKKENLENDLYIIENKKINNSFEEFNDLKENNIKKLESELLTMQIQKKIVRIYFIYRLIQNMQK